jgi:hypothetical protein
MRVVFIVPRGRRVRAGRHGLYSRLALDEAARTAGKVGGNAALGGGGLDPET